MVRMLESYDYIIPPLDMSSAIQKASMDSKRNEDYKNGNGNRNGSHHPGVDVVAEQNNQ
jgi:hypothetical protein